MTGPRWGRVEVRCEFPLYRSFGRSRALGLAIFFRGTLFDESFCWFHVPSDIQ